MSKERRSARLTMPVDDSEFWDWFDKQSHPMASIRVLVAQEIAQNGIQDTFWVNASRPGGDKEGM